MPIREGLDGGCVRCFFFLNKQTACFIYAAVPLIIAAELSEFCQCSCDHNRIKLEVAVHLIFEKYPVLRICSTDFLNDI